MGYVSSLSSTVTAYEPVTTSGEISFSGLGNGTDFSEIIDATIDAESYQLENYESQKAENEYIIDLLEQLSDAIDDFNDTLDDMDELDEFYSMVGTVSDDQVDVDVDGNADVGIHTIIVNQLALQDVWVNTETAYDSEETVVASSATTLSIDFDGETIDIDVAGGTTLEGLVTTINGNVNARDKFEASILDDGDGYYLVLKSTDAGSDNTISITDTGTLTGMSVAGFENTQAGQSAQIKVDGFPTGADDWIERDSNSIDDVVEGIEFNLLSTTDGEAIQVSIDYDTDDMFDTITEFTEELNQIILDIQLLTGRVTEEEDSDEETYTIDSYALDIVYNEMKSILSSSALGFTRYDEDTGGDYYTALSQIGFETDTDEGSDTYGQLILDEDELEEALDNDPAAVAALFAARSEGESDSEGFQVISVIDGVTPAGEHNVEYTVSGGVLVSATIDGQEASIDGWTILGTGSKSKGLYLSVSDEGDGDFEGTARVKQGKIGELSDSLDDVTSSETGTITLLIENYEELVTNLDNQIYNEEKRLDALETSLERRYAALDATLSSYENQSSLLTSLTAQLD
ncbi:MULTISPECIES: flagellar filament capping protein FliD [unclassified Pseudodesulfovibrio]|uniref:flagellar filament capping protein FliD n=1 Tax=unclassified Pseudodesulfovibrio TaxID=2661612 RepID=UPI000FEBB95B|nr:MULTISPECIES: flagellar filament capping protein FliD [unclassified Pseudodesulfovibrio]MCJ2164540.1 flagellar filament capping protein FliD [Pseudodesulfovibrio sp. S3-i]RWU04738.1 flagellar hook protein [Pseudodesulfovibrio sp. S3]